MHIICNSPIHKLGQGRMSDISGESLVIVTKTVESSAYLNKDISLYPSMSRSFKNMLKRYGPLILPCVVPLLTTFHWHVKSPKIILCFLPLRKLAYQLTINESSGLCFSFSTRTLCWTSWTFTLLRCPVYPMPPKFSTWTVRKLRIVQIFLHAPLVKNIMHCSFKRSGNNWSNIDSSKVRIFDWCRFFWEWIDVSLLPMTWPDLPSKR